MPLSSTWGTVASLRPDMELGTGKTLVLASNFPTSSFHHFTPQTNPCHSFIHLSIHSLTQISVGSFNKYQESTLARVWSRNMNCSNEKKKYPSCHRVYTSVDFLYFPNNTNSFLFFFNQENQCHQIALVDLELALAQAGLELIIFLGISPKTGVIGIHTFPRNSAPSL